MYHCTDVTTSNRSSCAHLHTDFRGNFTEKGDNVQVDQYLAKSLVVAHSGLHADIVLGNKGLLVSSHRTVSYELVQSFFVVTVLSEEDCEVFLIALL